MASSVSSQIIQNSNITAQTRANQTSAETKSNSSVSSQDFLYLLTQQLQYQDPMNPMDNSEMLAQEAQFATLEQMEALTSSFSQFSNVYQANSLLGQCVRVEVDGQGYVGIVEGVDFSDSSGASVFVGERYYPLSSITNVYHLTEAPPEEGGEGEGGTTEGEGETVEDDKNEENSSDSTIENTTQAAQALFNTAAISNVDKIYEYAKEAVDKIK